MVAAMAIEFAMVRENENAISRIRMPSPNVAMLSSVLDARIVLFATQTKGGNLRTAVPSPTIDSTRRAYFPSLAVRIVNTYVVKFQLLLSQSTVALPKKAI